jgi:hypothetical protein
VPKRNGRNGKKPHDDAGYRKRRKLLLASAHAGTKCIRCGKLAAQHPQFHKTGKRASWHTGHLIDGDNRGPLALEWSTCNLAAGGRLGYKRGIGRARANGGPPAGWTPGPHWPGHFNLDDLTSVGAPPCAQHSGKLCPTCADWRAKNPTKRG